MTSDDFFKHAQLFQAVKVGFPTYHYDVCKEIEHLLLDIYHQETYPMTTVVTFADTPENRQAVRQCYMRYVQSARFIKLTKN